ncbi:MAG TPA: amidohydrolase family protein [Bryobacteraceae bacterium]|nr:amidohydrolase family protein [Bryobacteraceae bacterium]
MREHLSLPKSERLIWGGLRNLLSGVTTVAHHNPYEPIFDEAFPVRVVRRYGWAHSIAFSPDIAARHWETPPDQPFVIHAAEGTDACARMEIEELERFGVLDGRTVLVHALGIDRSGIERVRQRGCSIVWCPSSNLLTYGRTLACDFVRESCCALGTDSAISAAGDMANEIRIAHSQGASAELLYDMVTNRAARILHVERSAGAIRHGAAADLIAVRDRGQTPAEALLHLTPELVVVGGRVRLISKQLHSRFGSRIAKTFRTVALEGRGEWFTPFDVPRLLKSARAVLGPEIRLAGKRVLE